MDTLETPRIIKGATRGLIGTVSLPADKSIAHRTALFASLASGTSQVVGYPSSADPQSTLSCLRQLGIEILPTDTGFDIHGKGLNGFTAPTLPLDCGNSGTTMRLLAGMLAGQSFSSILIGDDSLSGRPMGRIIDPLRMMGATVDAQRGRAPLHVQGTHPLRAVTYELPIASAQVKSCVLLAGLFAKGITTVVEHTPSRDHTERMLGLGSVTIGNQRHISVEGGMEIKPRLWSIPADFSAAAFFLVAGSIVPDSALKLLKVGLNPSRTGLIDVLRAMGANIVIENERLVGGEPIGDIVVRSAELHGIQVSGPIIANIIDEIPILCVAASVATGPTSISDASELRHKEADRIAAMATGLRTLGVELEEKEDGLLFKGGSTLRSGTVDTYHDHRIAMSMGIAALVSDGKVEINGSEIASVSFPTFWDCLEELA